MKNGICFLVCVTLKKKEELYMRSLVILFCFIVQFYMAGCGSVEKNKRPQSDTQGLRFAFITCAVDGQFFEPVKKGMLDAADMLGVHCDFMGTEGVDLTAQAMMVQKAVKEGYDGIALNIIDSNAFDSVIQEAMDAGVPVVGFNVDDQTTPNARLSSVNQQLYKAGESLAKSILKDIPPKAHVLLTKHDEGVSALEDRLSGLQNILKSKNVTWSVLISGNESNQGAEKIVSFLNQHPEIKIILCTGQSDTEAAGIAIEKFFAGKGYWSAGFDLSDKTLQLIKDGHIRCTIDQQPYIQGFYPVVQLTHYVRYGLLPSDINAGAALIDQSNIDQVLEFTKLGYR